VVLWNCGGRFYDKLPAILEDCGYADIIMIVETHLPDGCVPCVPGYLISVLNRKGAQRSSGGIAVLVHERLAAHVQPWAPTTSQHVPPSPYHIWFRLDAAVGLQRTLLLAAVYLPPSGSKYGLRSQQQVEEFFGRLGDEVAEASAQRGGADVLLGGDWNGHLGNLQEQGEYPSLSLLHDALGEAAEEVLLPCSGDAAPPPGMERRASSCTAPVCQQGRAVLHFCEATGLSVMNGRVKGDLHGAPTCYAGARPSVIDLLIGSSGVLLQATRLHVMEAVPEYPTHRPVELSLTLSPLGVPARAAGPAAQSASASHPSALRQLETPSQTPPQQQPSATAAAEAAFGPSPSFQPGLCIKEQLLPSYAQHLQQPAVQRQLAAVATLADSDPEAAAAQLHTTLYEAAAAVFPPARSGPPPRRSALRSGRQHFQPWFDEECRLARARVRKLALAPGSHLAKQAAHVLGSRYRRLLDRKKAAWRRRSGTALFQLHRVNARAFFKKWKTAAPDNPLSAGTWLRHFVDLQQKRVFKPSSQRAQRSAAATSQPATAPAPALPSPTVQEPALRLAFAPPSPSPAPPPPDTSLDIDWTAEDVSQALRKLSPSSSCLGPLKAGLIKAGGGLLSPVLARLFNSVFRSGRVPRDWLLGAITAIHKKGDTSNPNNYRGITVGHVLGKLFALMLNARLSAWSEAKGIRAVGQAGFRKGFRTTDNCFVLRALAERARAKGAKLYICAVDLEKAFDSVARPLLWASLQRAGIGGRMLATLQALYADVPVCVKTADGLSGTFQSIIGVKQGCPLSPLLFGIFLDDFEQHVERCVGPAAHLPMLDGHAVPPMLFADDMLVISTSVSGLNAQLRALQTYCDAKQLTVNSAKTQVMILRPGGGGGAGHAAGEQFFYAGEPLEVVAAVKYLGLTFAQLSKSSGFACCGDELARAGRRAMYAMRRRAWELGAAALEHQLQLFDIFVKPILSYGCEVWGVDLLSQPDSAPERVHRWLCRRLLGLP
jgi:hypothetical protein